VGSRFFEFWPGNAEPVGRYAWDITEHTKTAGWLAWLFLRAEVRAAGSTLVVHGRDACRSTCARRQGLVQPAQAGAVASRSAGGDVRPRLPGPWPLAGLVRAGHIDAVCEAREGAGPRELRETAVGGKAEKPDSYQAEWRPPGPDPGNAGEGRSPRRPVSRRGKPVQRHH